MRLEITDGEVCVTLSRKNLLTGLHKLEMEGSARTIYSDDAGSEKRLVLRFERDDEHYTHPDRQGVGAGMMHPETEKFIRNLRSGGESPS
jgi:hypothetical protein